MHKYHIKQMTLSEKTDGRLRRCSYWRKLTTRLIVKHPWRARIAWKTCFSGLGPFAWQAVPSSTPFCVATQCIPRKTSISSTPWGTPAAWGYQNSTTGATVSSQHFPDNSQLKEAITSHFWNSYSLFRPAPQYNYDYDSYSFKCLSMYVLTIF